MVGFIWALPNTILGLLLAVLGGAKPYRLRPAGAWHWTPWWGFWAYWYRLGSSWQAMTFGNITIISDRWKEDTTVIRHERQHLLQSRKLGPAYFPVYIAEWLYEMAEDDFCEPKAYRDISLERSAYAAESTPDAYG